MKKSLSLGRGVELPIDTVTDTIGVLAIKGSGKTHTAMVLAEELAKHALPVVVFDVVGVCWGLRLAADGKGKGLPFYIFGGKHADIPLDAGAGKVIADTVVEHRPNVVLDLSGFETKADQNRFILDFCTRLYRTNREPVHLVMDEADDYCPQKPFKEEARTLRAVEVLVRRGRARGIGVTLITQRSAAINKGVLTQISTLIVGRTISPQDRKAVGEWVDAHGTPAQKEAFFASIAALPVNEKWVWSPARDVFVRSKIRDRETYDSSFTPKIGDRRVEPSALSPLDLEALRGKLAAAIEQAKQDDPRELKATIAQLRKQLAAGQKGAAAPEPKVVEVPVFTPQMLDELNTLTADFVRAANEAGAVIDRMQKEVAKASRSERTPKSKGAGVAALIPPPPADVRVGPTSFTRTKPMAIEIDGEEWSPPKCERALLTVLAQRAGMRTTAEQLAILSGYSVNSSSFAKALAALRTRGCVVGDREDTRITDLGARFVPTPPPMPTGRALLELWLGKLSKAERALLEAIYDAHPTELADDELAERAGYSVTSSSYAKALGALRTLALVVKGTRRLGPALAEAF